MQRSHGFAGSFAVPRFAGSAGSSYGASGMAGGSAGRAAFMAPGDIHAIEKQWADVASALQQIHERNSTSFSFQYLYNVTFQLVKQHGHFIYRRYAELVAARVAAQRRRILELAKLTDASVDDDKPIESARHGSSVGVRFANTEQSAAFLVAITEAWEAHKVTTGRTGDLLGPLDKQYCAPQRLLGVRDLATKLFGEAVLVDETVGVAFTAAIIHEIQLERRGELPSAAHTLPKLARMVCTVDPSRRGVYELRLESPYIAALEDFYGNEASTLLVNSSLFYYCERFLNRLDEERHRAGVVLDPSSFAAIHNTISRTFVIRHAEALLEKEGTGVPTLLDSAQHDALKCVFRAFDAAGRSDDVVRVAAEHLGRLSLAAVETGELANDAVSHVEFLLTLRHRIRSILREAFIREGPGREVVDRRADVELTKMFESVVNKNAATPTFLAFFLDAKLRSTGLSETELERACEDSIALFSRFRDRDVFEESHKMRLGRRILAAKSTFCPDRERIFLRLLRRECGVTSTSSMELMLTDLATSSDLNEAFMNCPEVRRRGLRSVVATHALPTCESKGRHPQLQQAVAGESSSNPVPPGAVGDSPPLTARADLEPVGPAGVFFGDDGGEDAQLDQSPILPISVIVLTSGVWPAMLSSTVLLPEAMRVTASVFERFYLGRHRGRLLRLLPSQGTADVYLTHAPRRYDVNLPTNIAPVLLLFDHAVALQTRGVGMICSRIPESGEVVWTIEQIAQAVQMSTSDATRAVASLLRAVPGQAAVLVSVEGGGESKGLQLSPSTAVTFNTGFKARSVKVKIAAALSKSESGSALVGTNVAGCQGSTSELSVGWRDAAAQAAAADRNTVTDGRKHRIDSAIIRVLKAKKILSHAELVQEVTAQLQSAFVPTANDVKRRIEHLVEREFLERCADAPSHFRYLA